MRIQTQVHRSAEFWLWVVVTVLALVMVMSLARSIAGNSTSNAVQAPRPSSIVSPCEGFFYPAEYPGDRPLVQVGDWVTEEMIVGYVQSMDKVPVVAGTRGTIVEILVEEMTVVMTGDELFRVAPAE